MAVLEVDVAEYFERSTRHAGYAHAIPAFLSYQYTPKLTVVGIF